MTILRMYIACWMTKATNTHSRYVILIAFPLQQWLHERASVLSYTYIVCLVWYEVALTTDCSRVHQSDAVYKISSFSMTATLETWCCEDVRCVIRFLGASGLPPTKLTASS